MSSRSSSIDEHSSADKFYDYYAGESVTPHAVKRLQSIRDMIVRFRPGVLQGKPRIADVGCGAGTQSMLWADIGCEVHALDVNDRLVRLGKVRSAERGYNINFRIGSAVALPWPDESMQVCLAAELLEHVSDWEACLSEFCRVLAPGGILFASTTNLLCPIQQEFTLPLYSWYPSPLKRYCERLSITTRPQLANYAKYPAVHWFTFYGLQDFLNKRGFECFDRFDVIDPSQKGRITKLLLRGIRSSRLLRFMAYVATEGTSVVAVKKK